MVLNKEYSNEQDGIGFQSLTAYCQLALSSLTRK